MLFALTLTIHLASIATLFPELAAKTRSLTDVIVIAQFPLMMLAAIAHARWAKDEEEKLRSKLARLSLTFGITYVCLLLLATFGVSVGPANPFAAPEKSSFALRAGWFVGFTLIAAIGCRFFIATSILSILEAAGKPIRRAFPAWIILGLLVGGGLGAGAMVLLRSDAVASFAKTAQDQASANPAPYIIAGVFVPLVLAGVARALKSRRKEA